jgi:hypothetical protein
MAGMAALVLVAGCGGDDTAESQQPERPQQITKAEYVKRARPICVAAAPKLEAISRIKTGTFPRYADVARRRATVQQEKLRKLRALPPPDRQRAVLVRYFRALEGEISVLRRYAAAADDEDLTAMRRAAKDLLRAGDVEVDRSSEFGFVCGQEAGLTLGGAP